MSATMSTPLGADPMAGGAPMPDDAGMADADDNVVVTICKNDDGSYTVYAGDEPEGGAEGDMSEDDANAMGAAGNAPAPEGQPADSVGQVLKIAMTILQADSQGGAEDQFQGGFNADKAPTPATGMPQKF